MTKTLASSGPNTLTRRAMLTQAASGIAALSLTGGAVIAQTATPRVLNYSDHEPLGGMRTRFLKDVFFPAIERFSEGRLRIADHWDGEIAEAYDALGAVSTSANADMATVVPEYTAEQLPLHQIFKSFPMGPTGDAQVQFLQRVYDEVPEFTAELARNGLVNIYIGTGYPVSFFSTAPLADLTAIPGGRWRTASFWHRDFLTNAKATPVSMHWGPEIYEALRAGEMDGLVVNVDSAYMLKLHEAAPHVLASRDLWLGHVYLLAMKKTVWEGLASEDQQAIRQAAAFAYQTLGSVMDTSFDTQIADLRAAGATVRVISKDEARVWQVATRYQEAQAAWAATQLETGIAAAPVIDKVALLMNATLR